MCFEKTLRCSDISETKNVIDTRRDTHREGPPSERAISFDVNDFVADLAIGRVTFLSIIYVR